MSSTEGAFIISKKTSKGNESPCAADLASKSACSFSPLGIFFTEKPSKEASNLRTASKYFSSFGSLALLLLSTWLVTTYESDLRTILLIPIALGAVRLAWNTTEIVPAYQKLYKLVNSFDRELFRPVVPKEANRPLSFRSPKRRASYSAILFVQLKSNLAA
jgi:hypothetical protein